MRVTVYHDYYGCETGCCGHVVKLGDGRRHFDFGHIFGDDDQQKRAAARVFVEDIIRKQWPECLPSIDWDSLSIDRISDD